MLRYTTHTHHTHTHTNTHIQRHTNRHTCTQVHTRTHTYKHTSTDTPHTPTQKDTHTQTHMHSRTLETMYEQMSFNILTPVTMPELRLTGVQAGGRGSPSDSWGMSRAASKWD